MEDQHHVLYTSAEVRSAISGLFRDSGVERIAISAFLGDGAEAYLPSPKGLRIICSPTPGATNPMAIRRLLKRGATVEFADSLHMKVYWARQKGAVITSANLSTNAMGKGGLKEVGILIKESELDINRLLRQLRCRPALSELHALDVKHKDYFRRVRWSGRRSPAEGYLGWYNSPAPPKWKIFFYRQASDDLSDSTIGNVGREFGVRPHDWIWGKRAIQETDWVLCVYTPHRATWRVHWLFADRVFRVPKSDRNFDPEFPFEVVQAGPAKWYPTPPFVINQVFREALKAVLRKNRRTNH